MVRALHLQEMAAALSSEAATWRLLWHLYGISDRSYPGGAGGPQLPGCAQAPTVAQQIARILEQDADVNRYTSPYLALCKMPPSPSTGYTAHMAFTYTTLRMRRQS